MVQPYEENECRHDRRFDRKGVLTCQDCGAEYDGKSCAWKTDNDEETY